MEEKTRAQAKSSLSDSREEGIVQILIFGPDGYPDTDRQRRINLALEYEQTNANVIVKDIVVGTNNFLYAVVEYRP